MNDNQFDPWREDRYTIERIRTVLPDADPAELRAALTAGLDETLYLIEAAVRRTRWEWQFQRAEGAGDVCTAIGRRLDRP